MNIKKAIFLTIVLGAAVTLSGCGKKNQTPTQSDAKNEQANSQQSQQDNPLMAANVVEDPSKPISASDLIKEANVKTDCGTCSGDDCKKVTDCMNAHAKDCTSASGRITYPVPTSADKKKIITDVIVGEKDGKCDLKGLATTADVSVDTAAVMSFECVVENENLAQMFTDGVVGTYIAQNCSGRYVDFLHEKQAASSQAQTPAQ